mmetsp:Transcript_44361/g.110356  ORF Transcript_44361/g.110356 Transcript_44361/m.110356 type:complete len:157 (-) Transcript_44361:593-1063(-)
MILLFVIVYAMVHMPLHFPAPTTSGSVQGHAGVALGSMLRSREMLAQSNTSDCSSHKCRAVKGELVRKPYMRGLNGMLKFLKRAGWFRSEMYLQAFGLITKARERSKASVFSGGGKPSDAAHWIHRFPFSDSGPGTGHPRVLHPSGKLVDAGSARR